MYITIWKTDNQYLRQGPKPVLWDSQEGQGEEGSGRGVQDGGTHMYPWLIHVDAWQKPSQYCRVIILQLK